MEDLMAQEDENPLQETLDALGDLLGEGGSLPRRQSARDSRAIPPYDRSHQQGVYFASERNRAADSAAQQDACEVARQRTLAERHALNDYGHELNDFWTKRLEDERRNRR
jgi:hypothetical protein